MWLIDVKCRWKSGMEFIYRFQSYIDLCTILYIICIMYIYLYIFHVQNSWSNCGRNNCLKNVIFICKAGGLIYLKIQLLSFAIRRCKVSDINPGIQSSVQRRTVKEAINDPVAIFCCLPVCSVLFHFLWGFFFFFSRDGLGMTFKALLVNISQLLAVKGWKFISLKVSC